MVEFISTLWLCLLSHQVFFIMLKVNKETNYRSNHSYFQKNTFTKIFRLLEVITEIRHKPIVFQFNNILKLISFIYSIRQ